MSIHQFQALSIDGEPVSMEQFAGKVLLIVNVASECGLTPQYEKLEDLQRKYEDRGFRVLGFPCNQFGGQEPGTNAEILEFAQSKYGADFPMFAKIDVNGDEASEIYTFLKAGHPDEGGDLDIAWNFTKFLVGRDGQVIARFGPQVTPEEIAASVEENL